jgi:SAM-dependent methyltransferase
MDWARDYFERGYAQRWGLPPPSDAVRREATGLCDLLHLSKTSRVIDIGCGHGRHALAIAERGPDVTGLDFSTALLDRARQLSSGMRAPARWILGDMRQLPLRSASADAAILTDAFGFFETDAEHDAVLREAARVLSEGGRLAVKIVNGGAILDAFRAHDREERSDGTIVSITRTLSRYPARMTERVRLDGPGGQHEYERRQRLYRVDELRAALEHAGLFVDGIFAAPDRTPFDPVASSTMWAVGQRRGVSG